MLKLASLYPLNYKKLDSWRGPEEDLKPWRSKYNFPEQTLDFTFHLSNLCIIFWVNCFSVEQMIDKKSRLTNRRKIPNIAPTRADKDLSRLDPTTKTGGCHDDERPWDDGSVTVPNGRHKGSLVNRHRVLDEKTFRASDDSNQDQCPQNAKHCRGCYVQKNALWNHAITLYVVFIWLRPIRGQFERGHCNKWNRGCVDFLRAQCVRRRIVLWSTYAHTLEEISANRLLSEWAEGRPKSFRWEALIHTATFDSGPKRYSHCDRSRYLLQPHDRESCSCESILSVGLCLEQQI